MRGASIHSRVAIVFPGALGDLLLALPALRALRARHAKEEVTLVVNEPLRALAGVTGVADSVASLDAAATVALFAGGPLPAWLQGRPVVYSWLGARDAGMRARVESAATAVRWMSVERGPDGAHAAAAYAGAVGVSMDDAALGTGGAIRPPPPSPAAEAAWRALREPVLVVHAGAGARAKRWAAAGFAAVAMAWEGDVLAVMGPAEVGEEPPAAARTWRDPALPDLAVVLGRAAAYVGNDSGVSHLAGAVGARGVVIFGPTAPERWRPLGRGLVTVRGAGSACAADGIPLSALGVADVMEGLREARADAGLRAHPRGLRLDKAGPRD